jgi:hypothetical protein
LNSTSGAPGFSIQSRSIVPRHMPIYAPVYISYCTGTTENVSRASYDALLKKSTEPTAAASPESKDWFTGTAVSPVDSKPALSNPVGTTVVLNTPSNTSTSSSASGLSSTILVFSDLPPPQLDPAHYPNVKNWFNGQYRGCRKRGKAQEVVPEEATGSVLSSYMVDDNGNQVPEATKRQVRKDARDFFNLLLLGHRATSIWSDVGVDAVNQLSHNLETNHKFLWFCDNHWKSQMVATNSYSQWYSKAVDRRASAMAKIAAKGNVIDVDADDIVAKSSKRPRAEGGDARDSKRPRLEEAQPTIPLHVKVTTLRQRVRDHFTLTICTADCIQQNALYE